jgi:hypothetical protein
MTHSTFPTEFTKVLRTNNDPVKGYDHLSDPNIVDICQVAIGKDMDAKATIEALEAYYGYPLSGDVVSTIESHFDNVLPKTKTLPRFTLCKFGSVLDYALHEYGMHMVDDVRVWTFANSGDAYDMTQCDDDLKTGDVLLIPSEKVVGITNTWPLAITKEIGHLHGVEEGYKIEDLLPSDTDKDYVNKALKVARSLAKSYDI